MNFFVRKIIPKFKLVPDWMVTKLALEEIPDAPLLLDGFPRSVGQAKDLDNEVEIDAVIDLDVPFDVIKVNLKHKKIARNLRNLGTSNFPMAPSRIWSNL